MFQTNAFEGLVLAISTASRHKYAQHLLGLHIKTGAKNLIPLSQERAVYTQLSECKSK